MALTEVRLFGAPRIESSGTELSFHRRRALGLVAYLADSDMPSTRDSLLGLLWPDFASEDARNGLRRELSLLKQMLGSDALLVDRTTVTLTRDPQVVWCDCREFRRLVSEVLDHGVHAELPCLQCIAKLESAAALYTADFLSGFAIPDSAAFDEWQYYRTEELRRSYAFVLENLSSQHASQGGFEAGLNYAKGWLALDPTNEAAVRAVMRLLVWSGRSSAATREYEALRGRLRTELGIDPEPETLQLSERILKRQIEPPESVVPTEDRALKREAPRQDQINNLPSDTTPFIGRNRELGQLDDLLSSPSIRLVSILGPGGMGKTRLALAWASRQLSGNRSHETPFPDGVFFVPLSPIREVSEIASAVARIVGYTFSGQGDHEQQLIDFLRPRRLLLVMDNYEHLLSESEPLLASRILEGAPEVTILATSRMRLGSRGESVLALKGLEVDARPDDGQLQSEDNQPLSNSAVDLFEFAAQRIRPEFIITSDNRSAVLQICHLVGGMPLGIELAAGWTELYTLEDIAIEISKSPDFLESTWRDTPERQSSLRAVFDTSWRMLSSQEQLLLASLSIFRGGFDLAAAESVAAATPRMLLSLVNKSWMQRTEGQRFQIHEMLRQYAEEQLAINVNSYISAQEQHANYYSSYVGDLNLQIRGAESGTVLAAFSADLDNITVAWRWMITNGRVLDATRDMLPGLFRFAEARFNYHLILDVTESGLAALDEIADGSTNVTTVRLAIMTARNACFSSGWPARFISYSYFSPEYRSAVAEAWQLRNHVSVEPLWTALAAWLAGMYIDFSPGQHVLEDIIAEPPPSFDLWDLSLTRQLLGGLFSARGPWRMNFAQEIGQSTITTSDDASLILLEEALTGFRKVGDAREQAITLMTIAFHYESLGHLQEAVTSMRQAREIMHRLGETLPVAGMETELGIMNLKMGDFDASFALRRGAADKYLQQGQLSLANGSLSSESYDALRHSTVEHALVTRERALSISRQTGNSQTYAWDLWEMGEIHRFTGHFREAEEWYAQAWTMFQNNGDDNGLTFYDRGLGEIALGEGNYAEAYRLLELSLRRAEALDHPWSMIYATRGMADAALGMDRLELARDCLADSLRYTFERLVVPGDPGGVYLATYGTVVRLFQRIGMTEEASELTQYVLEHPLTWNETRRTLEKLAKVESTNRRTLIGVNTLQEFMTKSHMLFSQLTSLSIAD